MERQIRADVPVGTPRAAVEDYLRQRGLEFVAIEGELEDKLGDVRVVDLGDLGDRVAFSTVKAIVEPALVDPLWKGEVKVYFFFDQKNQLIGYAFVPWAHTL